MPPWSHYLGKYICECQAKSGACTLSIHVHAPVTSDGWVDVRFMGTFREHFVHAWLPCGKLVLNDGNISPRKVACLHLWRFCLAGTLSMFFAFVTGCCNQEWYCITLRVDYFFPLFPPCLPLSLPGLFLVVGESGAMGGQGAHHLPPDEHRGDEHASGSIKL